MAEGTEELVVEIARRLQERYYGKYPGRVVDNMDPLRLARLKLEVPSVLGAGTATGWALPCLPMGGLGDQGSVLLPEIGARVWAEFAAGDISSPIWTGTYWTSSERPPDEAVLPSVRVVKTAAGHLIVVDDTPGSTTFMLQHPAGAEITIDVAGTITLADGGGNVVAIDSAGGIEARDAAGASLAIQAGSAAMADAAGGKVEITGGSVTIKASGTITLDAAVVMLGGAGGEPVLKGLSFLTAFATHIHPSGMGPTGPPVPGAESNALSTKVTSG